MPKHIVKVARYREQHKVTLPRLLVDSKGWQKERILVLEEHSTGHVELRTLHLGDTVDDTEREFPERTRAIKRERKKQ